LEGPRLIDGRWADGFEGFSPPRDAEPPGLAVGRPGDGLLMEGRLFEGLLTDGRLTDGRWDGVEGRGRLPPILGVLGRDGRALGREGPDGLARLTPPPRLPPRPPFRPAWSDSFATQARTKRAARTSIKDLLLEFICCSLRFGRQSQRRHCC
jgi:hypothetical protein